MWELSRMVNGTSLVWLPSASAGKTVEALSTPKRSC